MRAHVLYLKLKRKTAKEAAAKHVNDSSSNNTLPPHVHNDERMKAFIQTIEAASLSVDCAAQFNRA